MTSIEEKKKKYELEARYTMHWYVGFESLPGITPSFSRCDTDNKERAMRSIVARRSGSKEGVE